MLRLALKARLPLIAAHTRDTANLERTLRHLSESQIPLRHLKKEVADVQAGQVWYRVGKMDKPPEELERWFSNAEATLVLVNWKEPPSIAYDAGAIPTDPELIQEVLTEALDEEQAEALLPVLGGLTIMEVLWALSLAQAKHGEVTPRAVADVRKTGFPAERGLQPVDLNLSAYVPESTLLDWLAANGAFFHDVPDPRLRVRGLLFDGPPGTGKTMGAKFTADQLGVPLYRVAFEEVKDKWVGNSEKYLAQALAQADAAEPCVLLFDEIEKLVAGHSTESSGVTQNLLATLLWWLEEHQSKVFVIFTTNNTHAIPPELWRPHRIDEKITFPGLLRKNAVFFLHAIADTYESFAFPDDAMKATLDSIFHGHDDRVPQAQLAQVVASKVKETVLKTRNRRGGVRVRRKPRKEGAN